MCTGNICRSAAAHVLTAAWPAGHMGLTLEARSAGTHATSGRPVHRFTAVALERRGVDAGGHSSRRVSAADLDWADLVLTMTAQHREAVLTLNPRALRRTFTLREAATLCGSLPPRRLTGVPLVERGRAFAGALAEVRVGHRVAYEDIDDPVDGPATLHTCVVDEIAGALRILLVAMSRQVRSAPHTTAQVDRLPPVPLSV